MKPEIKAWLPELPASYTADHFRDKYDVYSKEEIEAWLDKLTEGAEVVYASKSLGMWNGHLDEGDRYTALLICPREIKKQTPLEIMKKALELIAANSLPGEIDQSIARTALEKSEAAK